MERRSLMGVHHLGHLCALISEAAGHPKKYRKHGKDKIYEKKRREGETLYGKVFKRRR